MTKIPNDELSAATTTACAQAWSSWGELDPYVLAPLINPAFMGGPEWPGLRQAHLIVRRDIGVLMASDGLAEPIEWSDDDPTNGYEVEVYGITGDHVGAEGLANGVGFSWLGLLVRTVSNTVARLGWQFTDALAGSGLLTMACPGIDLPDGADRFRDPDGHCVVMLGLTDPELPDAVDGPLSRIRLVNVKLLTEDEGDFCLDDGAASPDRRAELARRLREQGQVLWSSLERPSVV
jgi:hypothetical protein